MQNVKRLVAVVGSAAILVLLASCAAPQDEGGPDPGLRGQWQLQTATDDGGAIPLANQLISLTIDGDNSTAGRSTCSDYTAHVYGTVSTLWVTATVPHSQPCIVPAQQSIERRYLKDLNQVRTSTVTGGVLHLLAPGIDLQYQRALAQPLDLVVDHEWKLATLAPDGYYPTPKVLPESQTGANITFTSHGFLIGETRCNLFTAKFTENAGELVMSGLVQHAKPGCDVASQKTDARVMSLLTSGFTFLSGGGALTLASPRAGLTLGFVE